jgi:hypothetical protein
MIQETGRGYRWGKFQAWGALAIALAQFVLVRGLLLPLLLGAFFLALWRGLMQKQRYGFVLFYVCTVVAIGAGLLHLAVESTLDVFTQLVLAGCFWGIPAAFYYPKRYREFGFGKPATIQPTSEGGKRPAVEIAQVATASRGGEGEIRRVGEEEWREAVARYRVEKMREPDGSQE